MTSTLRSYPQKVSNMTEKKIPAEKKTKPKAKPKAKAKPSKTRKPSSNASY